ncbi:MarR family winged helix-turn-helix transcriptional regulator [Priestia megaterium]|uniref:MarR family winged helix-turn-helix transcriptional regulator n=1 Tax=Priestia megaterium TaxID=1404 RepID=UPI0025B0D09B|nr:MarR family transcriptional regulator [Priestia megaterium]MDN3233176.1 MarR family transcriptional regulator [Priestia megaterium]
MKLDEAIGFLINTTARNLILLLSNAFSKHNITSEQWTLLKSLEEKDGITTKELVTRVQKDQGNVTRILGLLEEKSLVEKRANPKDKRSTLIYLTSEGSQLIEELIPLDEEVQEIAIKDISTEDLAILKKTLTKISENIVNHTKS